VSAVAGGNPNEPACVRHAGQCSNIASFPFGEDASEAWPFAILISVGPFTEQISAKNVPALFAAASAWEIDGRRAAIEIARHATHAVKYLVSRLIFMAGILS
jgi:hypothetical protein